jgi:hypothetical protein
VRPGRLEHGFVMVPGVSPSLNTSGMAAITWCTRVEPVDEFDEHVLEAGIVSQGLCPGSEGFNDPIIRDVENLQTRRRGYGFAASGSRNTPRKRLPKVTPRIFLPPSNAATPAMARLSTPPLA